MGKHTNNMLKRVKHVVAEDVNLILEDSQDLSNRGDIEESVHRCEKNSFQGSFEDISTHVTLISLHNQASELGEENTNRSIEGCLAHVCRVGFGLMFRVNDSVVSIDSLNIVVQEFLSLGVDSEQNNWKRSANECPKLRVSIFISVNILVFFINHELSDNLVCGFVNFATDTFELFKLLLNLFIAELQNIH